MMELPNKFFADEDAKKFCCEQSSSADQSDIRVDRSWWGLHTSWMMLQRTVHSAHGVRCHTVHSAHQLDDAAENLASEQCTWCTMSHCTVHIAQFTIAQDSTQHNTQGSVEDSAQCSTQCTVHSAQYTVWHNSENCTFAATTSQALIATCTDHVIKETNKIFEQCQ